MAVNPWPEEYRPVVPTLLAVLEREALDAGWTERDLERTEATSPRGARYSRMSRRASMYYFEAASVRGSFHTRYSPGPVAIDGTLDGDIGDDGVGTMYGGDLR